MIEFLIVKEAEFMQVNKLQFIQKSRPKLKQGDIFYYIINNKIYCGLLFLTKDDVGCVDIGNVVVLPNYSLKNLDEFSADILIQKIQNGELIAPPTNINQRAWTQGYFKNFEKVDVSSINKLEDYRITHSGHLHDRFYNKIHDYLDEVNIPDIPDVKFLGDIGLYAYEGIEYIIQLGLGLDYNPKEKPYDFYEDFSKNFTEKDLPYWYFNSIGKKIL